MTSLTKAPATSSHDLIEALARVQKDIARACRRAGRSQETVTLTAVTKTQPLQVITLALEAGLRTFGENRVQEAQAHWAGQWEDQKALASGFQLRLIGPLQTNKVDEAVRLFDVIETVDRPRLVDALANGADKAGRCPQLLVQVNTGAEPQKGGVLVSDLDDLMQSLHRRGLPVRGLMCIPPVDEAPGPHFALLAKLARRYDLPELSMGMSADFETAIRFGATHIRLGSALFGARSV